MSHQRLLPAMVGLAVAVLLLTACTPAPTSGEVRGVLVRRDSGQPMSGMGLQLLIADKTATGTDFRFGEGNPHTETDQAGAFAFKDVAPGSYGLGSYPEFFLPIMADGPSGVAPVTYMVTAGQVTDLGKILVR